MSGAWWEADAADVLAGYRTDGPPPDGFGHVMATSLVMAELGQVARGRLDPQEAAARVRELLQ